MDTPVKRSKITGLGKKWNPSRGPTKHWKGLFPARKTEKWLSGTEKDFINLRMNCDTEKLSNGLPTLAILY